MENVFEDFSVGEGSKPGEFEVLPPNDYVVTLESWEMAPASVNAKDPNGIMFKVRFAVLDGVYKGRLIFDQWCWKNLNITAQNIGRGKVTALAEALGWKPGQVLKNPDELLNKPVVASIKVREAQGNFSASNQVVDFSPVGTEAAAPKTLAEKKPKKSAVAPVAAEAAGEEAEGDDPWK